MLMFVLRLHCDSVPNLQSRQTHTHSHSGEDTDTEAGRWALLMTHRMEKKSEFSKVNIWLLPDVDLED